MANLLCDCDSGLGNLGLPNCDTQISATKKFGFIPQFTTAGVENFIDPAITLNLAWVKALVNNSDKSVRLFMSPKVQNADLAKGEPTMESFEDKSSNFIAEDTRKVKAIIPECSPRWKANFEAIRCNANTYTYLVDLKGNLIGCKKYGDGKLYPIPVNPKSAYAGVVMAKDASSQQVTLQFDIPNWFDDSTICMINAHAFTDFNFNEIGGLIDANINFSSIAAGSVVATITTPGTSLNELIPIEGLVIADFISSVGGATSRIRNTTDNANVTITTVTETSPGVYALTYTLAAAKNVVVLALLSGIDFFNLRSKSYVTV